MSQFDSVGFNHLYEDGGKTPFKKLFEAKEGKAEEVAKTIDKYLKSGLTLNTASGPRVDEEGGDKRSVFAQSVSWGDPGLVKALGDRGAKPRDAAEVVHAIQMVGVRHYSGTDEIDYVIDSKKALQMIDAVKESGVDISLRSEMDPETPAGHMWAKKIVDDLSETSFVSGVEKSSAEIAHGLMERGVNFAEKNVDGEGVRFAAVEHLRSLGPLEREVKVVDKLFGDLEQEARRRQLQDAGKSIAASKAAERSSAIPEKAISVTKRYQDDGYTR